MQIKERRKTKRKSLTASDQGRKRKNHCQRKNERQQKMLNKLWQEIENKEFIRLQQKN